MRVYVCVCACACARMRVYVCVRTVPAPAWLDCGPTPHGAAAASPDHEQSQTAERAVALQAEAAAIDAAEAGAHASEAARLGSEVVWPLDRLVGEIAALQGEVRWGLVRLVGCSVGWLVGVSAAGGGGVTAQVLRRRPRVTCIGVAAVGLLARVGCATVAQVAALDPTGAAAAAAGGVGLRAVRGGWLERVWRAARLGC
jgi:hypothetical protein